ncbi:MAG TPA: hypothetical protein VEE82_02200, partial [Thermodesulfovibrionales bacterium]|nr:hypothetical protein [Thermodesulfovibrionales bacterium]
IFKTSEVSASQAALIEKATTEQANAIQEISRSLGEISGNMGEISKASSQQQVGNEQIVRGVEEMKEISRGIETSTVEQSKGADIVAKAGDDILVQITLIKNDVEEMKASVMKITKKIEAIRTVATSNLWLAKEMTEETSKLTQSMEVLESEVDKFRS